MPSPTMIKWGCIGVLFLGLVLWAGINEIRIANCKRAAAELAQKTAETVVAAAATSEKENVKSVVAQNQSSNDRRTESNDRKRQIYLAQDIGSSISDCTGSTIFSVLQQTGSSSVSD